MTSIDAQVALTPAFGPLPALAPGLALTAGIAALAFALRLVPGVSVLSPMILSVIIGVLVHNFVGAPHAARNGMAFSLRAILRFAIILLGLADHGATGRRSRPRRSRDDRRRARVDFGLHPRAWAARSALRAGSRC